MPDSSHMPRFLKKARISSNGSLAGATVNVRFDCRVSSVLSACLDAGVSRYMKMDVVYINYCSASAGRFLFAESK